MVFLTRTRICLRSRLTSFHFAPLLFHPRATRTAAMSTGIQPPSKEEVAASTPRYIDIGINLTDPIFRGIYHGSQKHEDDLSGILSRAREAGCQKLIMTGSDMTESQNAIELANQHPGFLYCTVGVHPCSSLTFTTHPSGPADLLSRLKSLAETYKTTPSSPIVAFGEIGLDYDRLFLCPKDEQLQYFAAQLDIAVEVQLPLFLHSRAAAVDFARLLNERLDKLPKRGVVHSFTGTEEEMLELVEMGFDIGVNGCSLKTKENIEVVKKIPIERIQLETDGPWCEMRPSHASAEFLAGKKVEGEWKSVKKEKWVEGAMVKGRNEPCMIGRVAVAVAAMRGISVEELSEQAWKNSVKMFGLGEL